VKKITDKKHKDQQVSRQISAFSPSSSLLSSLESSKYASHRKAAGKGWQDNVVQDGGPPNPTTIHPPSQPGKHYRLCCPLPNQMQSDPR
jgi:hypothetical protein